MNVSISKLLNVPPNNAKISVKGPVISADNLYTSLRQLGLTADDLAPIDWRKKADLVHVKNQGDCGDCWAQSSCSALSDRFMIKKNIQNLDINATIVTQCAASNVDQGCNGDNPYDAGMYFSTVGGVDSDVVKNCPAWRNLCDGSGCTSLPTCDSLTSECISPSVKVYKTIRDSVQSTAVTRGGPLNVDAEGTIINMKRHLLDGPYPVCFFVPNDFYGPSLGYKWSKTNGVFVNGMYNDDLDKIASQKVKSSLGIQNKNQWGDIILEGGSPAGHAVELVGWGMENAGSLGTIPCWYIKNSWGPDWNENGYFRMAMNDGKSRYNALLGLDVPVSSVILSSTGQSIANENALFGSGTVFSPDLNTGDSPGTILSRKAGGISIGWWILIGVAILALVIGIWYLIKK